MERMTLDTVTQYLEMRLRRRFDLGDEVDITQSVWLDEFQNLARSGLKAGMFDLGSDCAEELSTWMEQGDLLVSTLLMLMMTFI